MIDGLKAWMRNAARQDGNAQISGGKYKGHFWGGAVVVGHLLPIGLLIPNMAPLSAVAAVLAVIGLYFYEHAFVMAPQEVPNS